MEGPAADAEGNVFFSEIRGNRILKWSADSKLSVFREPSYRANGLAFDALGRLVACEGAGLGENGGRRVTRTDIATRGTAISRGGNWKPRMSTVSKPTGD